MLTKEDFDEWKRDERTRHVMKYIEKECFDIAVMIARTAGIDQLDDRYNAGVIKGLEKVLVLDFDEVEEVDAKTSFVSSDS